MVLVKCTHGLHPPTPCATSLSSLLLKTRCHFLHYIFKFCSLYKLSKKIVKCFPKLVCSEVSVINKNFLSNRSLLYCVISLSKNTLPSFTLKKFSHDKLPWSISKLHAKNRNKTRSIITGTHHNLHIAVPLWYESQKYSPVTFIAFHLHREGRPNVIKYSVCFLRF